MKHVDHFNTLLTDTVNLSKLNLDILEDKTDEVFTELQADETIGSDVLRMKRQGSWAQRTIITPQTGTDFDADVMVKLRYNPDWVNEPRKYPNAIYNAIKASPVLNWRDFERHARCVRIQYSGMHVDVVPYVVFPDGTERIINRDEDTFEITTPDEFTAWMKGKDELANNNLRKVIRLVKYLRDHKGSFTGTPSIIITTLVGNQVTTLAKLIDTDAFKDVPSTLLTIVTDLNEWLAGYDEVPPVKPSGTSIDFTHRWKPESFDYFKKRMAAHGQEMYDAFHEQDSDKSVEKWQALFGDGFKAPKTSTGGKFGAGAGGSTTTGRSGRAG